MKKSVIITLFIASFFSTSWASERTPNSLVSCTYKSSDVGTIVGYGSSIHKARSQASESCFDRRADLFERNRGEVISEDRGMDIIDSCVNIHCQ